MTAKVKFEILSGLYCDLLNYLTENGYYISDIKSTDFGFTAVCLAKEYKSIAKAAKKFQCKINIINKKGIYFKVRKLLERKGAVAGAVLVFIYVFIFSHLIWRIDVIAPDKKITEDVYSLLYANECYTGAVFNQQKNQKIIQQIFMNVDNVGYVTLNFYKGILTCKIDATINKMPYLEDSVSGNITATADGIIEELEIYNGFSDIKIGQTVSKGDLLVSATYIDRNGTLQQVMPRAFIKAYCVKEYSAQVEFNKTQTVRTGEYSDRISYKIAGKSIPAKKENIKDYINYDREKFSDDVDIMGFMLPITKETVRYHKKEQINITNDEKTAYNAAKKAVDTIMQNDKSLLKTEDREYYSKISDTGVTVFCKVYGHYNITK